jgi:hypothetical protein
MLTGFQKRPGISSCGSKPPFAGGLETARADELEEIERKRHELRAQQIAGTWDSRSESRPEYYNRAHNGIAGANLLSSFFFD